MIDPGPSPGSSAAALAGDNRELASLIRLLRSRRRYAVFTWHLECTYHDSEETARQALGGMPAPLRAGIVQRETGEVWATAPNFKAVAAFVRDELPAPPKRAGALGDLAKALARREKKGAGDDH